MDNKLQYFTESLGFDLSTKSGRNFNIRCSQCQSLVINGIPCHEQGCPNMTFECRGCSNRVTRRGAYCPDCQ